jgi:glycosyltransferase involved in cell wall biosynthesis
LCECLDSVVNQSFRDIEIIAINDGSTDRTPDIISEYASKDSRVVFVNRENRGVAFTENEGIKLAKGEYVSFLDSDDYYHLDFLKNAWNSLQANGGNLDIVRGNVYHFTGSAKRDNYKEKDVNQAAKLLYNKVKDASDKKLFKLSYAWTSIYRKAFLIDNSIFWNEGVSSYNDVGFLMQALALAKSVFCIDVPATYYRQDNVRSTVKNVDKLFRNFFIEHDYIAEKFKARVLFDKHKEILLESLFRSCRFALFAIPFDRKFQFVELASKRLKERLAVCVYNAAKFNKRENYDKICLWASDPKRFYEDFLADKYKVSVVIYANNAGTAIQRTLESVVNQTLKNIEIVLVDDGSTNKTSEIIEEYARSDLRISVFRLNNQGVAYAKKFGVDKSHGVYWLFLNAGEIFGTEKTLTNAFDEGKNNNMEIVQIKDGKMLIRRTSQ